MKKDNKQNIFQALKLWFERLENKQKIALISIVGGIFLVSVCSAAAVTYVNKSHSGAKSALVSSEDFNPRSDTKKTDKEEKIPGKSMEPFASELPAGISSPSPSSESAMPSAPADVPATSAAKGAATADKSKSASQSIASSNRGGNNNATTSASNANADYNENSEEVQEAARIAESSSNIARNAASQGGSDVVDYQERNEIELKEYVKEEVPEEEQRLIATSAAACDIMDRLGIDLIGVPDTTVSAIAARYDGVTRIGSPMAPDMEIIKTLKPTDVIGPDTLQADLQMQYDNIGVHSTFINLRSVEGLYDSVRILGDKYGKSAEADAIIQEYHDFMDSYSSGHNGSSPRVLVLMGLPGSYLVATQNSYAGSLVELAGGTNVFHHESKDFISVNTEALFASDPDVIIRTAHGLPNEVMDMFEKEFQTNDIWKHFRAVREGRSYDVDYMLFGMSATFDYPQALADLEPMLYGK